MAKRCAPASASACSPPRKTPRLPPASATTLPDLVTLLHLQLVPFLSPRDVSRLLRGLSRLLQPSLRESIASWGLCSLYECHAVHFGQQCSADWHQLVPQHAEGGQGPCVACCPDAPEHLPLPKLLQARENLLEAACLAHEGFSAVCDGVLQMHYGEFAIPRFGSMQPVVFSLSATQEQPKSKKKKKKTESWEQDEEIDTDDKEQLTRLLDAAHRGVGTQFFSGRKQRCTPTNSVEAHWRSIAVDANTGLTVCGYCQFIAEHSSKHRCERCSQVFERLLQQHCKALYQPLKLFMLRHLKHVRYVKPCRGWNCARDEFRGDQLLDLIAGFTPAGVLCGVYLTDLRIQPRMISDRLALGAFKPNPER